MVKDGHHALQKCLDYLEIEEDEKINVMRSKYKRRPDGSIKIVQTKPGMHFENVLSDAFCRNGCLCLANYVERVDIPLRDDQH